MFLTPYSGITASRGFYKAKVENINSDLSSIAAHGQQYVFIVFSTVERLHSQNNSAPSPYGRFFILSLYTIL